MVGGHQTHLKRTAPPRHQSQSVRGSRVAEPRSPISFAAILQLRHHESPCGPTVGEPRRCAIPPWGFDQSRGSSVPQASNQGNLGNIVENDCRSGRAVRGRAEVCGCDSLGFAVE
jgi:hypothetical protein